MIDPHHNDNDHDQVLHDATTQYWRHIVTIVRIAFAIHVALFIVFLLLEVPIMLLTNAASVVAYVVCLKSIAARRYHWAGLLLSVEIIAHAMIATWVLGWESNFYFYVFCIVPVIAFSFHAAWVLRLVLSLAIVTLIAGGYAWRAHLGLGSGVSPAAINALGVINALGAVSVVLKASALSVRFSLDMQLGMYQAANRDSLTNLYTRRRVLNRVRQLRAQVRHGPAAIVMLDIDHFKQINDVHGHDLGDAVLKRVADVLASSVRVTDMAARWGGEEFLLLMPDTRLEDARQVAERILQRIRDEAGQIDGEQLRVSATLAIATVLPGEHFAEALNRADRLLYEGKHAGRDRVVVGL